MRRDRESLARLRGAAGAHDALSQLEGIEGVPARGVCELANCRAEEARVESCADELVELVDGERPDGQPLCHCEAEWGLAARASGGKETNRLVDQPAAGELDCQRGGTVEPVHVVDGYDDRCILSRATEQLRQRDRDRTLIGGLAAGVLEQQCGPQCVPLRRRKGADLVAQLVEQITECRKGQLPFGGRRPRLQDAEASTASLVETGGPQRRLADSGVAFEQQLRPGVSAQKLEDAIELCLAPDEGRRGRQGHVEDDATARSAGQVILTRSGGPARAVSHPRVTMSRAQPRLASDRSRALARDSRRPRTSAAGSTSRTRSRAHAA